MNIYARAQSTTYDATQRVQAQRHLRNVAPLKQVGGLEDLLLRHAVLLDCRLEALHVLHQLEVGAALLDLFDRAGRQLVGQTAQHLAVLEDVLVLAGGHRLAEHGKHPRQHLQFLFLVARLKRESAANESDGFYVRFVRAWYICFQVLSASANFAHGIDLCARVHVC